MYLPLPAARKKSFKNTPVSLKKDALVTVQKDTVINLTTENRKIPEMGLNVWMFKYTPKNAPEKGIKTGLLISSDKNNKPIPLSEDSIQIFLDSRHKVVYTILKKEQADSIARKIFAVR